MIKGLQHNHQDKAYLNYQSKAYLNNQSKAYLNYQSKAQRTIFNQRQIAHNFQSKAYSTTIPRRSMSTQTHLFITRYQQMQLQALLQTVLIYTVILFQQQKDFSGLLYNFQSLYKCLMQFITQKIVLTFAKNNKHANKLKPVIEPYQQQLLNALKIPHTTNRTVPQANHRNVLITSALPYVNNTPHLGNIIGAVLSADVYARYCRLMGYNVFYLCGTDEYGTATQVKALQQKSTPRQICDRFHLLHKQIYQWFDISFDHFGRTSSPLHTQITQDIFKLVHQSGAIVSKASQQLYCPSCTIFLADRYVRGNCKKCGAVSRGDQCDSCSTIINHPHEDLHDVHCAICQAKPQLVGTQHLYLQLNSQAAQLKEWLVDGTGMESWSNNAKGITKGWFNSPAVDRCITRDLKWGVPVPLQGYQNKIFYVWFEAPIGYISITADCLGEDYKKWWLKQQDAKVQLKQFMGKDNTLFHSIIFPTTLLNTKLPWNLPQKLSVTQYLKYQGGKFSKSNNMGVFGDQCAQTGINSECWRYYLLRTRPQSYDSQFSWRDFADKCNKQLLNSIGNLVQRVLKAYRRQFKGQIVPLLLNQLGQNERGMLTQFKQLFNKFKSQLQNIHLLQASGCVIQFANMLNQYVAKTQFWRQQTKVKHQILALLVRMLRVLSYLLQPFVPSLSAKINYLLGCPSGQHHGIYLKIDNIQHFLEQCLQDSTGVEEPVPLLKEISQAQVTAFKQQFGTHTH